MARDRDSRIHHRGSCTKIRALPQDRLPTLHAQAPQQPSQPRFEVASIKENKSNDGIVAIQTQKGLGFDAGYPATQLPRLPTGFQLRGNSYGLVGDDADASGPRCVAIKTEPDGAGADR